MISPHAVATTESTFIVETDSDGSCTVLALSWVDASRLAAKYLGEHNIRLIRLEERGSNGPTL